MNMNAKRISHIFQFMEYDVLTDWEQGFVESVEEQFNKKKYLSSRQYEILEKIFEEAAERK